MLDMADKKPKTKKVETPPPSKRDGVALHVWLDPALMLALEKYIESREYPPTKTAVTENVFRAFLREQGFWPPSDDQK